MANPPQLTPDQRADALKRAAEARAARAELKEKLKIGSVNLKDLLERAERDDTLGKMKVITLLESLPGLGKVKARRVLEEIGVSETRRVQGLGTQQRAKLLELTEKG